MPTKTPKRHVKRPAKETVLVTGATGRLGHRLSRELLKSGVTVRALINLHEHATRLPPGTIPFVGDITDQQYVGTRRAKKKRIAGGYVDRVVDNLEEAMTLVDEYKDQEKPFSIGLIGNAVQVTQELAMRGVIPDVLPTRPRHT